MAAPMSLIEGKSLASAAEDFKNASRVEQYRVGAEAFYIPSGFRWSYIPFSAILSAEESHDTVTAGHCVTVRERRPSLQLKTVAGDFSYPLDKAESLRKLLAAIRCEG